MPCVSGEEPSIVRASTLTISLAYRSSAPYQSCLRVSSTTFFATSSVFICPALLPNNPAQTTILVRGSRFRREMHSHVRGEQQRGMGLAPHQLRLGALQLRRDKERRFRTAAALTKRSSLNRVLVTWPG